MEKKSFLFQRTGKAVEQLRQMDSLEVEIENWKKNYIAFLESWEDLSINGGIHIAELDGKLQELKSQSQNVQRTNSDTK